MNLMSWWSSWRSERKAAGAILQYLPMMMRQSESRSGAVVNWVTAVEVPAVVACVRAIAEGIAQVPIKAYRSEGDGGWVQIHKHRVLSLLNRPNPWQDGFQFRETAVWHLALTGNCFIYKVKTGTGRVVSELLPIEPHRVTVERAEDGVGLRYRVTWDNGRQSIYGPEDIWHLRGPSWNGWMGLDAVRQAREAIGLAMSTEWSHAKLHANGAKPSGLYSIEGNLSAEQYAQLSAWLEAGTNGENAYKPMILDRGAKWTPLTMSGVDAQHLETRKYQVEEICRAFRVIPMMVGYSDKTATYASAEQMFIAHVVHTLHPWASRLEQQIMRELTDGSVRVEIDLNGLMRGASADRASYNSKALGSGNAPAWMTPNEVRANEGLDWIEGGDELPKPVAPVAAKPGADDEDDDEPKPDPNEAVAKALAVMTEMQGAVAQRMTEIMSAVIAAGGKGGTQVVLPQSVTVDAVKAVGATFTEVEERDEQGRIKSMLIRPVSGIGPTLRRTVIHDEKGRVSGHEDEMIEEITNG